jgi:GNAT superfamily N-acetyltransferase
MPTFRVLSATDWPGLAPFLHRHNRRPDGRVHCLHTEQGESEESHAQELRELPADEGLFIAAEWPQRVAGVAGVVGAEFDPPLRRAWLRGPLVAPLPGADAEAEAEADTLRRDLIAALLQALPQIDRFDAFPSADEAALISAYHDAGFVDQQQHHVMRLDAGTDVARTGFAGHIVDARPDDPAIAQLQPLHDRLFPNSYLPGERMAADLDEDHHLFIARLDGQAAGYLYIQYKPHEDEGYVDFLGVDETARGRGAGRALLQAAVDWALRTRRLPKVHLTVRQDRAPALGLYESLGFRSVAAGLHLQLQR